MFPHFEPLCARVDDSHESLVQAIPFSSHDQSVIHQNLKLKSIRPLKIPITDLTGWPPNPNTCGFIKKILFLIEYNPPDSRNNQMDDETDYTLESVPPISSLLLCVVIYFVEIRVSPGFAMTSF